MTDASQILQRPVRAGLHCRHYGYEIAGPGKSGPRCAIGVLEDTPGAARCCMPNPKECCDFRAEWTSEERSNWEEWVKGSVVRLSLAVAALPAPIPLNTSDAVPCPNCGAELHFSRWRRGASVQCATADCCAARFSIEDDADWPVRIKEAGVKK